jgi:hypothetical protein
MTISDDTLDRVEEIYLNQKQYLHWMCADTPRPDIFGTREGKVVLKNMNPVQKYQQPPSILSELGPLAEAALGPGWKRCEVQPAAPPSPVPVRKLERPADAVWTFFCYNCHVIGVHDDGTVVVRLAIDWCPNDECRVTLDGTILKRNRVVDDESLAIWAGGFAKSLKGALKEWVQRAEGRKMPPGIPRLIKRSAEAHKTWPIPDWKPAWP